MRSLSATLLLTTLLGCSPSIDGPFIEDREAFVDLSLDEQSAMVGDDARLDLRITELTDELDVSPTAKAYSRRGAARVLKGKYEGAMSDFAAAIDLDPSLGDAHYNRGVLHSQLLEHDLAITDYTNAVNADPDCSIAYANRGMEHLELKQYERAISDLRKAMELDAEDHLAMHACAIALFEKPDRTQGDADAAERLAERACEHTGYEYQEYVKTLDYITDANLEDAG